MADSEIGDDVAPKYHLVCSLDGASEFINGMPMVRQADGSVKTVDPVTRDVALNYKGFGGWSILSADDSDAAPTKRAPGRPKKELVTDDAPPVVVEPPADPSTPVVDAEPVVEDDAASKPEGDAVF